MLTKVLGFIENLGAVIHRTLPSLFTRFVEVVHMFLPIRGFAERRVLVFTEYAEPSIVLLLGAFFSQGSYLTYGKTVIM